MLQNKLRDKIKAIRENKNNKGFTLVELIVVIVILAILIGVTIGGIYMYVGQSRENTDINNASSITSVCGTANADQSVYKYLADATAGNKYSISWKGKVALTSTKASDLASALTNYVSTVLPDGLPESKTGKGFKLTFEVKESADPKAKSLSVKCEVLTSAPATDGSTITAESSGSSGSGS